MTEDQKAIDVVLQNIIEARAKTAKTLALGKSIVLERQPNTPIWDIKPSTLLRILRELEKEEEIIALCLPETEAVTSGARDIPAYNYYTKLVAGKIITPFQTTERGGRFPTHEYPEGAPDLKVIHVRILDGFDNWYAAYRVRKTMGFSALSEKNLEKIKTTVDDIDEKFQLNPASAITITIYPDSSYYKDTESRKETLDYLKAKGVVLKYEIVTYDPYVRRTKDARIQLDVSQFQTFRDSLASFLSDFAKSKQADPEPLNLQTAEPKPIVKEQRDVPVYEIKYTTAREILLNGICLAKPDFNSENDNFFQYVFNRPNQKISIEELKKAVGGDLKKDPHKILQNLGFKGGVRKAFFDVSKDTICFRNPLRKKDLEDLQIDYIRAK
jgi:hypothetical protein